MDLASRASPSNGVVIGTTTFSSEGDCVEFWLMMVAATLWLVCLVSIKDKTKDKKHVVAWVTSTARLFIYFWMHNLEIVHMEKSIS
jgi:hypothetical protein